jgi:medium-chain acyl-[acyl-carrier-protein] hydrolase
MLITNDAVKRQIETAEAKSEESSTPPWLFCHQPRATANLRLFFFPYAGGGASLYRTWAKRLGPSIEVCPVQLPGRENKLCVPPFTRLQPLVEAIADALSPLLDTPFAFFGHSMGAIIGFELARQLRRNRGVEPEHLFVSGHGAPHLPLEEPPTYELPEAELIEELRRLNGTPQATFEHPELLALMLPVLRADMAVCQTYEYRDESALKCPITAIGGLEDVDVSRKRLEAWREHTDAAFKLRMLPGDHFFLHSKQFEILRIISREIA